MSELNQYLKDKQEKSEALEKEKDELLECLEIIEGKK